MRRISARQPSKAAIIFALGAVLALVFSLLAVMNVDSSRAQAQSAGEQQVEITQDGRMGRFTSGPPYLIYGFRPVNDVTLSSITAYHRSATMIASPNDTQKQVTVGGRTVPQTGTRTNAQTWTYTFNNPVEVKAGQLVEIHIPSSNNLMTGWEVKAFGTQGGGGGQPEPEPSPDPEPEPSEPVNPPESTGPLPGCSNENSGTQTPWPPREPTAAERQRGQAVYVVTSTPYGQQRNNTQLWRQTIVDGEYDYEQIGGQFGEVGKEVGWVVNALAYNKNDNYLYAISQVRDAINFRDDPCFPAGHLLQIHPETAEVRNLGLVTKPGTDQPAFQGQPGRPLRVPNDLYGGINAGEFDLEGNLWVSNSSQSGTKKMYRVNIANVTAVQTDMEMLSEDYALSEDGKYFFGIRTNLGRGSIYLERLNLTNGRITTYDITDLRSPVNEPIPQGHTWGRAWTYGNGNLGFGTGGSGADSTLLQLEIGDPDRPNPRLVNIDYNAPRSYNTDGTSNGFADLEVDLAINKTRITEGVPDGWVRWRLEVENVSEDPNAVSSGFTLNDTVPDQYTGIRRGDFGVTGQRNFTFTEPKIYRNSFQIVGGELRPGAKFWIELDAKLPDDEIQACVPNVAHLVTNEKDPNLDNNIGQEDGCGVTMEKKVVDANGDGEIDYKDGQLTENFQGKDYKVVKYDIEVKNPSHTELSYQLVDEPQFAQGVTPAWIILEGVKRNDTQLAGNPITTSAPEGEWPVGFLGKRWFFGQTSGGDMVRIDSEDTHTYQLKVLYEMPDKPTEEQRETYECAVKDEELQPGRGLYNQATLTDEKGEKITSEDCIDLPLNIELLLTKIGFDGTEQTELPLGDAAFALHHVAKNEKGEDVVGAKITDFDVRRGEDGQPNSGTVSVEEGKSYYLVEAKAPEGYNLLPNPVKFTVTRNAEGEAEVTLDGKDPDDRSIFPASVVETDDVDQVALQIADTKTGELPKTGGPGIWYHVAAGLVLMLGAVGLTGWQRRRA